MGSLKPPPGPGAYEFYVSIVGNKQGKFKGDSAKASRKDWIAALSFSYEVSSPRDAATGQATGKRQHRPVTITKEWGASSPQIFEAVVANESLKSILFEFVTPAEDGTEHVHQKIKLTNAVVTSFKMYTAEHESTGHVFELEDVSFTFQKIEIDNLTAGTAAEDASSTGRLPARFNTSTGSGT